MSLDAKPEVASKVKELHNRGIAFRDEIRLVIDDMGLAYE